MNIYQYQKGLLCESNGAGIVIDESVTNALHISKFLYLSEHEIPNDTEIEAELSMTQQVVNQPVEDKEGHVILQKGEGLGKLGFLTKEFLIAQAKEWEQNHELEELEIQNDCLSYYDGENYHKLYFSETDSYERILNAIQFDDEVLEYLNPEAVAKLMYHCIERNSLMAMERMVLTFDDEEKPTESVRNLIEEELGDADVHNVGCGALGSNWTYQQFVFLNVKDILDVAKEEASNPYEWKSEKSIFEETVMQTLFHELRHTAYDCNEMLHTGENTPYPEEGREEWAVEEYGNQKALEIHTIEEAHSFLNIFSEHDLVNEQKYEKNGDEYV